MTAILIALTAFVLQIPAAFVEGQVVRTGTNEPVARASVLLTRVGGRLQDSIVVSTDGRGTFSIPNVPAGTYRLFADHTDYVKVEYGQRSLRRPGSSMTLAPGQKLGDITLSLTPTAAISGRAVDGNGDPARARIQVLSRGYAKGEATLNVVAEGQTNDLGEYRVFGVPPGSYIVSAAPYGHQSIQSGTILGLFPPRLDMLISISGGPASVGGLTRSGQFIEPEILNGHAKLTQYYRGVTDPAAAQRIELQPGAVFTGVNFQLAPVAQPRGTSVKVRGYVIDGMTLQPAASGNVQLSTPDRPFAMQSLSRSSPIMPAGGAFEIDSVDPGKYVLLASSSTGVSGVIPMDVGNSGVDGLRIVLEPRITLNGRISVDGSSPGADFTKMTVLLDAPSFDRQITPRVDGTFSAPNVMPGNYRIVLGGTLSNLYLKAARLGDREVLNGGLSLSASSAVPLELVVSANTGTLDGSVFEGERRLAAGVRVVLVPDSPRRKHFEMYRAVSSGAAGKFRIEGIAPGEYTVFAWEDMEENAWQIPEILRAFEGQGKTVHIGEGGRQTLDLQMIPK